MKSFFFVLTQIKSFWSSPNLPPSSWQKSSISVSVLSDKISLWDSGHQARHNKSKFQSEKVRYYSRRKTKIWKLKTFLMIIYAWVALSFVYYYLTSDNAFVSRVGGLRFKSWAGQIGHSVANGSPPQQHFFGRSCVARAQWRDGLRKLATRFNVLQRVKKWFIWFELFVT